MLNIAGGILIAFFIIFIMAALAEEVDAGCLIFIILGIIVMIFLFKTLI